MFFPLDRRCVNSFLLTPLILTPSKSHVTLSTQLNQSASVFHRLFSLISYYTCRNADLDQTLLYCATSPTCLLISCPWPDFPLGSWALPVPCLTLSAVCPSYQPWDNAMKRKKVLLRAAIYSASHWLTLFLPFPLSYAFIPPHTGHIKIPDKWDVYFPPSQIIII